jgi:hypothetical protein
MPSRRRSDAHPRRRDPITDAIERRAYELFLERGGQHGRDLDDWFRAEREILDAITSRASSAAQSPTPPDKAR